MTGIPYVTLSCAMSLDGYLDSARPPRLTLSNAADFDRVDAVRAASDVILVGARTIRRDDPRLLVRSDERREERAAAGLAPSPWKATVTATGDLDPSAAFFTAGDARTLVYCPRGEVRRIVSRVGARIGNPSSSTRADRRPDRGSTRRARATRPLPARPRRDSGSRSLRRPRRGPCSRP